MRIVFIGSGNIASFFALRLHRKGHSIIQVYSRSRTNAEALAIQTGAVAEDNLNLVVSGADVYFIAVKDDVLAEVAAKLDLRGKTVIHCAGARPLESLGGVSEHKAVIWALYSVRKERLPEGDVPLVVEASTLQAREVALNLAAGISGTVWEADFRQRQMLHLNAVFVNNFTNHLLAIAQKICEDHQLPFEMLNPIIRQTLERAERLLPSRSQTGPAIRGDRSTMEAHLSLLEQYPSWQQIYADITTSIRQYYLND